MLGQKLMLCQKNRYQGYREFVAQGNDEDTLLFFKRNNVPAIIGDKAFRHWLNELLSHYWMQKAEGAVFVRM
jgi:hypothetical protein